MASWESPGTVGQIMGFSSNQMGHSPAARPCLMPSSGTVPATRQWNALSKMIRMKIHWNHINIYIYIYYIIYIIILYIYNYIYNVYGTLSCDFRSWQHLATMSFSLRWENTITTLKWRLYVISLPRSLVFRGPILHTLHVLFNWLAPRIPYGILLEYSSIHVHITIDSIFHDYINQDKSPNCRSWYATLNPHQPSIFIVAWSIIRWCPDVHFYGHLCAEY